tara:strand:- start:486 stop:746 length:261 start_codon:yes stop_codon:yes gene_type:complete
MTTIAQNITALSNAIERLVEIDDGFWIDAQRPKGKLGAGLGKTLDVDRLNRALTKVLTDGVPQKGKGEGALDPIWAAIQSAYKASL